MCLYSCACHWLSGEPQVPLFIAPSVVPHYNPGVRLVEYSRTSGLPTSIHQYYLDLQAANSAGSDAWQPEYTTHQHYSMADLGPASLMALKDKMLDPGSQEFRQYWQYHRVSPPEAMAPPCDHDCHASIVCGMTNFHMDQFTSCKQAMVSGSTTSHGAGLGWLMVYNLILACGSALV